MKRKIVFGVTIILFIGILVFYSYIRNGYAQPTDITESIVDHLTPQQQQYVKEHAAIRVGFSDQLAPFFLYDESAQKGYGLAVDFVNVIIQRLKLEIEPIFLPENELKQALEENKIEIAVMVYDKNNMKTINYTNPIIPTKKSTVVLFSQKEEGNKNISAIRETIQRQVNDKGKLNSIDTTNSPSVEQEIQLARNTLADESRQSEIIMTGYEPTLRYYIEKLGLQENAVFLTEEVSSENFCLAVHKKNPILYDVLNRSIYTLDKNAVMAQLQGKWFGFSYELQQQPIIERGGILFIILAASVLCTFYIFYGSNKTLYEELATRMEQVSDSKNELQTTFDGVSYYMIELDLNGKVVNVNKAFRKFIAEKGGDMIAIGKELTELFVLNEENREKLQTMIAQGIHSGLEEKKELISERRTYACRVFPVRNTKEKLVKILVTVQDITKEKAAERQMIQDNKMIAVGQLAAGVAHEIRNPLGLIRNYCYVLKTANDEDEKREKAIQVIEKAVDKSGKIIDNLLNFSRTSSHQMEKIFLKSHIDSVLSLQKNRAVKNDIQLMLECKEEMEVLVYVESLDMVLINLTANAMDAIISKREQIAENIAQEVPADTEAKPTNNSVGIVRIHCTEEEERWHIAVMDDGEGMKRELIEEIFNPFFTTKEKKDGNGLGLYIVYNEVQKMHGQIQVESEEGKGTRFVVTVPKIEVK